MSNVNHSGQRKTRNPNVARNGDEVCPDLSPDGFYCCTLVKHHMGKHVAHDTAKEIMSWPNKKGASNGTR